MTEIVEKLKRYIPIRVELENEKERRTRMRAQETYHPAQMSGLVNNRVDYEEKPPAWVMDLRRELDEIERSIDALDDPLEREVLRLRYIDGDKEQPRPMRWKDVAQHLYGCKFLCDGSRKNLQRIHTKALMHLQEQE